MHGVRRRTGTRATGSADRRCCAPTTSRGWIHPATRVHDGSDPEAAIAAVLGEPGVVEVHSRNVAYGCFMFVVTAA